MHFFAMFKVYPILHQFFTMLNFEVLKFSFRILRLMAFTLSSHLGIDLGTSNVVVYEKGKGIVYDAPSVIAVKVDESKRKTVVGLGEEAKKMLGKTPESVEALCPIREGVITDYESTELMLKEIFKVILRTSLKFKPRVLIAVPYGVTEVERKAVRDSAKSAGAWSVDLVLEPLAAAIGAGLPVGESIGTMVLSLGGGTTQVAIISSGGVVYAKSIRLGGNNIDEAIVNHVRKKYSLYIAPTVAESAKVQLSSRRSDDCNPSIEVQGRDLIRGVPRTVRITFEDITIAASEMLSAIYNLVKNALENVPPELAADIVGNGFVLTGGGALFAGLDEVISKSLGIKAKKISNPRHCVALGLGFLLNSDSAFEGYFV